MPRKSTVSLTENPKDMVLGQIDETGYNGKAMEQTKQLVQGFLRRKQGDSFLVVSSQPCGKKVKKLVEDETEKTNVITILLNGLLLPDERSTLKSLIAQFKAQHSPSLPDNVSWETLGSELGKLGTEVIVILDELDLFAGQPGQALLYSLLDATHSSATPILIIAISSALDVRDLLEKRVRSRFSQSTVYFDLERSDFEEYMERINTVLSLAPTYKPWNASIKDLLSKEKVKAGLERLFLRTQEWAIFQELFKLVVLASEDYITENSFSKVLQLFEVEPMEETLESLSNPELLFLVTVAKHLSISNGTTFTFQIVYEHFRKFTNRKAKMIPNDVVIVTKIFEHLESLELILPVSETTRNTQRSYALMELQVPPLRVLEFTSSDRNPRPSYLKNWARTRGFF